MCKGFSATCARRVFAVGSEDLPARIFLTYFTRKSAFKRFGFHPEGTIGIWKGLAAAIERDRGQDLVVDAGDRDRLGRRRAGDRCRGRSDDVNPGHRGTHRS